MCMQKTKLIWTNQLQSIFSAPQLGIRNGEVIVVQATVNSGSQYKKFLGYATEISAGSK